MVLQEQNNILSCTFESDDDVMKNPLSKFLSGIIDIVMNNEKIDTIIFDLDKLKEDTHNIFSMFYLLKNVLFVRHRFVEISVTNVPKLLHATLKYYNELNKSFKINII